MADSNPPTEITAAYVPGRIALDPSDPAWYKAPETTIIFSRRLNEVGARVTFAPGESRLVKVKAVHNGAEIFLFFQWNAIAENNPVDDYSIFADAFAIEIPLFTEESPVCMGTMDKPVNIIFWRADLEKPENIVGGGMGTVQASPDEASQNIRHYQRWTQGVWNVIIARQMAAASVGNSFHPVMTDMPKIPNYADVRCGIYRLLSLGFRYPKVEVFKTFQSWEFFCEMLDGVDFEDFKAGFVETFDAGSPLPPCPPYEGFYGEKPRTAVLLEVSEFYRHFGLAMSQKEGERELPDHISAELEFLHFLTFKEAQAVMDGSAEFLEGYLLAQKDFLERHPLRWVPEFCDRLRNSGMPFYARLAEVTSVFLGCEHELVTSKIWRN